jgi:hypothetical protein
VKLSSESYWKIPKQIEHFVTSKVKNNVDGFNKTTCMKDGIGVGVKWSVGQPLGLQPSFAAFALSHHAIVLSLRPSFYKILGDDIVIDERAGKELLQKYADLGIDISHDKSVTSNKLAEFGGRIITPNRILTQPKWKEMSDRNFVDFARNLGVAAAKSWAKTRQLRIYKILEQIPTSAHPLGLGQRDGRTFSARMEKAEPLLKILEQPEPLIAVSNQTIGSLESLRVSMESEIPFHGQRLDLGDCTPSVQPSKVNRECHSSREFLDYLRSLDLSSYQTEVVQDKCKLDQMDPLVESILETANVNTIKVDEYERPEGWKQSDAVVQGDPRGTTTLEILEKKLTKRRKYKP